MRPPNQATESRQVTALRSEIAELRANLAEHDEVKQKPLEALDKLAAGLDAIEGWVGKQIEARILRSQAEMACRIAETFGELRGRIAAIDPTHGRAKSAEPFKFANERDRDDEVPELPNFLPARAIN